MTTDAVLTPSATMFIEAMISSMVRPLPSSSPTWRLRLCVEMHVATRSPMPARPENVMASPPMAMPRRVSSLRPRVMTAEHLMAIALHTGRAKDHARLVMFVEAGIADVDRLRDILSRHSLLDAWAKFENRFLQP